MGGFLIFMNEGVLARLGMVDCDLVAKGGELPLFNADDIGVFNGTLVSPLVMSRWGSIF